MDFNELKKIAKKKNISLGALATESSYSRAGFHRAIDNKTMEFGKLDIVCSRLGITPLNFFDTVVSIESNQFSIIEKLKMEIERKDLELKYVNERLQDKEEIINLMKSSSINYYAASPKEEFKKPKK